ncbi:MAG TPA: MATE family efflux transporter [Tepidisphaeraceae bacterium]|jgi:putative MATE family efflux protein
MTATPASLPSESELRSPTPLLWPLIWLALPVLAEHALHILVGMTDTYLANNLVSTERLAGAALDQAHATNAAAGAAVGSVTYILWFIGLIVSSIGTGATAIIARAIGARHRRLANKVCGQSILGAAVIGTVMAVALFFAANPLSKLVGLEPDSAALFAQYVRVLSFGFPFAVLMFTANSCLRGAGDTVTPAVAMISLDIINLVVSATLAWGLFGFEAWGFVGIAIGTTAAYIVGGVLQIIVLLVGRGGIRLFFHRLKPDWHTLRRVLRIGIPSGSEGLLMWLGNFAVLRSVNQINDISATAHNIAIRVESLSYMSGFAVATAVATMVGQSLGAKDAPRAQRAAYFGYGIGGGMMVLLGGVFILFSRQCASLFSDDPLIIDQAAQCLFLTGFIQIGFSAAIVFGSALRGAGDTTAVMVLNLASILIVRCGGVLIISAFGATLFQIWLVLCGELLVRGLLLYGRFASGRWKTVEV